MLLSKDQISSRLRRLPIQDVPVPELAEAGEPVPHVRVRTLAGFERDQWEADCYKDGKLSLDNVRARLVALTVVDEQGNRMFNDLDAQILGRGSAAALDRIYTAARKLSGIDKRDEAELVGELKNARSGDSGSSSPPTSE